MAEVVSNKIIFAIINNIPSSYHSSDLRNYFSQFIESKGFQCFHFKHRPETYRGKCEVDDSAKSKNAPSTSLATNESKNTSRHSPETQQKKSTCCIIKLEEEKYNELRNNYHKNHWLDRRGNSIPSLCIVQKVKILTDEDPSLKYVTRGEQRQLLKDKETFSQNDIDKLPELHPPVDVMPNGNVGTPTSVFLKLIQQCKLPPGVIKKLGLTFPKTRSKRRYGNVPMDYGTNSDDDDVIETRSDSGLFREVLSGKGHEIESDRSKGHQIEFKNDHSSSRNTKKKKEYLKVSKHKDTKEISDESDEDSDNDGCEEWERHEALHDDPTNAERNKERLYEEEIELKWEKGGSGLVFYTDAQYWKEQEGDFDEQTADDWDVDMSVYYEENGGDKDARDFVSMRQMDRWRSGEEATDMRTGGFMRDRTKRGELQTEPKIGSFEKHTKGIGRKVLKRQGWSEGEGLGSTIKGMSDALENEGQIPSDKRGFGYHGAKLDRNNSGVSYNKKPKKDYIISTIYDNPEETDPTEPLLRRNHHSHIKYRHGVQFQKAKETE